LPPAARASVPQAPVGTSLAQFDVPVVHRPLAVYALVGIGQEGSHE
jgi:hypothetical protein